MLRVLQAELWKLKGSRMPLWTAVAVLLTPMLYFGNQMRATNELLSWEVFMRFEPALLGGFGALLFGLVAAYVFGREYTEGTARNILTLPIRRGWFVAAKMLVLAVWVLALTVLFVVVQATYGTILGLESASWSVVSSCLGDSVKIATLIFATLPLVALLAVSRKGYLEPMSYSGAALMLGMGLGLAGQTRWFPWSMPVAVAGGVMFFPGGSVQSLVPGSWLLMLALFVAGFVALLRYVDIADAA